MYYLVIYGVILVYFNDVIAVIIVTDHVIRLNCDNSTYTCLYNDDFANCV